MVMGEDLSEGVFASAKPLHTHPSGSPRGFEPHFLQCPASCVEHNYLLKMNQERVWQ